MTNAQVIEALRRGAATYPDGLDRCACLRAAAWLRWMDAFGVAVSTDKSEVIRQTRRPAGIARAIMADLLKTGLPQPPEDITLEYLAGDDGDGGGVPRWADTSHGPGHK